jgi:hypothetical protein
MDIYYVSAGADDLAAISICEPDETKWEFKRALFELERFEDDWTPFQAELIGGSHYPLGAFAPTNLVGGILGVTTDAINHEQIGHYLTTSSELLPLDLDGYEASLFVCHRIFDAIDWEASSWHTISTGGKVVTKAVILEDAVSQPGFFRTAATWNQLFVAVDEDDSFIDAFSRSELRGLTFRPLTTTANKARLDNPLPRRELT